MKSTIQSTTVLTITLNEPEIQLLRALVQNFEQCDEDDALRTLRRDLFDACDDALKRDIINAN